VGFLSPYGQWTLVQWPIAEESEETVRAARSARTRVMETASKEVMKTTIFYSALLFLLIASLAGLAVATAMRP
jgi:hypothetical protein